VRQTSGQEFEIESWIVERRSPRAFAPWEVPAEALRSMLEAARWAASCFNEQPWSFVVASRSHPQDFEKLLSCLVPGNQAWAARAGALLLVVARTSFEQTGKPNVHAWHDCGLALGQLSLQAAALGLCVHPMAGFDAERCRSAWSIPPGFEPVAAVAIGYPGDPSVLPEELAAKETALRRRKTQHDFVFGGVFGTPLVLDEEHSAESVLQFWFGDLDGDGLAAASVAERWWTADPAFDEAISGRFSQLHARAASGGLDAWRSGARSTLALIVLLDQFSRNLFRGTSRMFACDTRAQRVALEALERGLDRALRVDERAFVYLPLMHAEDVGLQDQCVSLFEQLRDESSEDSPARARVANQLDFAVRHRDIVAQWGRFPHRNGILGRVSTMEEQTFLESPGSSF